MGVQREQELLAGAGGDYALAAQFSHNQQH